MLKILVIEIENVIAKSLLAYEDDLFVNIQSADNVKQGLKLVKQTQFDVIIISCMLPEEAAYQDIVDTLRQVAQYKTVPIFIVTQGLQNDILQSAFAVGVTDVFSWDDKGQDVLQHSLNHIHDMKNMRMKGKILYVEDTESVGLMVKHFLTEVGLQVYYCVSGEEALQKLDTESFDLVITDLMLAGKVSGLHIIRKIRHHKDKEKRHLPILVVTGFDKTHRQVEVYNLGANDCLIKPIIKEILLVRVNQLLVNRQLIQQLQDREQALEKVAVFDMVTELYNRYGFLEFAIKYISDTRRTKRLLALLILDLDDFKSINDNLGHHIGDEALKVVGDILKKQIRVNDIAARWGGDEFAILLQGCDAEQAKLVGIKLLEKMKQHQANYTLQGSIGVSVYDCNNPVDFDELMREADMALYQAKDNGKGCVESYHPDLDKNK